MKIIVKDKSGNTKEIPLREQDYTIGRDENCDIPLRDPRVSRQHARIEVKGDSVRIIDLGSSNGTFIEGKRIQNQLLKAGDVIDIGGFFLTFGEKIPRGTADFNIQAARVPGEIVQEEKIEEHVSGRGKTSKFIGLFTGSLNARFLLALILFVIFTIVFIVIPVASIQYSLISKESYKKGIALARFFAAKNKEFLKSGEDILLDVESIMKEEGVLYAYIVDNTGKVRAPATMMGNILTDSISQKAVATKEILIQKRGIGEFDFAIPITHEAIRIGVARLGFSTRGMSMVMSELSLWLIISVPVTILLGFFLARYLTGFVTTPLNHISEDMELINKGRQKKLTRIGRIKEISNLAEVINDFIMRVNLKIENMEKRVESEIIIGKERMSAILKSVTEGVIYMDTEGKIAFINMSAQRIMGLKEQEGAGKHLIEIIKNDSLLHHILDSVKQSREKPGVIISSSSDIKKIPETSMIQSIRFISILSDKGGADTIIFIN